MLGDQRNRGVGDPDPRTHVEAVLDRPLHPKQVDGGDVQHGPQEAVEGKTALRGVLAECSSNGNNMLHLPQRPRNLEVKLQEGT